MVWSMPHVCGRHVLSRPHFRCICAAETLQVPLIQTWLKLVPHYLLTFILYIYLGIYIK